MIIEIGIIDSTGGQHLCESMSSGSSGSNSYSNSSSGDGLVLGPGRGGCDTLDRHHLQQNLLQDEEYEDFQDSKVRVCIYCMLFIVLSFKSSS